MRDQSVYFIFFARGHNQFVNKIIMMKVQRNHTRLFDLELSALWNLWLLCSHSIRLCMTPFPTLLITDIMSCCCFRDFPETKVLKKKHTKKTCQPSCPGVKFHLFNSYIPSGNRLRFYFQFTHYLSIALFIVVV